MSDWYDQRLASRANDIAMHRAKAEWAHAKQTARLAKAQERIAAALERLAEHGVDPETIDALAVASPHDRNT